MAASEQRGRLVRVLDHDPETRSLFLRPPARLDFRPGQFISCLLPVGGERLTRPYTIASNPGEDDFEICLDRVGIGSAYLLGLPIGAEVTFTGPWGTFVLDRAPDSEAVFIADGTGIAPIRPMLHRAVTSGPTRPLRLVHATRPGESPLYRPELQALARAQPLLTLDYVANAELCDIVVRRWIDADAERGRRFFICGVGDIVPTLRDHLRAAGYERRAVQYERW
jgi:CDP-4-dehydro-6-deoxyglucose reductase